MKYLLSIVFLTITTIAFSQTNVNWLSLEEAQELRATTDKKMMVFVYTDWCGVCKMMDRTVFKDESISAYLNTNFLPVKFNAEQKESVEFNGFTFDYVEHPESARGMNQFAIDLLQGNLMFPSIAFFNKSNDVIDVFQGLQPKDLLEVYLKYLKEDAYLTEDWYEYSNQQE